MAVAPRNTPLRSNTTALRIQYVPEVGELVSDDQEKRLYIGDGSKLGGLACFHTDLLDNQGNRLIGGVGGGNTNYLQVTNGSAGNPARIQAAGGDANVQLLVLSKGTSQVLAGPPGLQVPVNQRRSDNPGSASNGEQSYRTESAHEELYLFRGTPARWLAGMRDQEWTFNGTANGVIGRHGAFQATASLGLRVDYTSTLLALGWNLSLSAGAASSALEIVSCDGTPTLLLSVAVGANISRLVNPVSATGLEIAAGTTYAIRWNDGGAGVTATGFITAYMHRRAT